MWVVLFFFSLLCFFLVFFFKNSTFLFFKEKKLFWRSLTSWDILIANDPFNVNDYEKDKIRSCWPLTSPCDLSDWLEWSGLGDSSSLHPHGWWGLPAQSHLPGGAVIWDRRPGNQPAELQQRHKPLPTLEFSFSSPLPAQHEFRRG